MMNTAAAAGAEEKKDDVSGTSAPPPEQHQQQNDTTNTPSRSHEQIILDQYPGNEDGFFDDEHQQQEQQQEDASNNTATAAVTTASKKRSINHTAARAAKTSSKGPTTSSSSKSRASSSVEADELSTKSRTQPAPVIIYKVPGYAHAAIFGALLFGISGMVLAIVALIHANDDNDGGGNAAAGLNLNNPDGECVASDGMTDCMDENAAASSRSWLDIVYKRGYVTCGLSVPEPGFVVQTGVVTQESTNAEGEIVLEESPIFDGFDVDLCRALAAALFDGNATAYVPRVVLDNDDADEKWTQLNNTQVDLLFRQSHTMDRDVYIPAIGTGVDFGTPYFYDGLGLAGLSEFVECAESGIFNGTTCANVNICVVEQEQQSSSSVSHDEILMRALGAENIRVVATLDDYYAAFPTVCNVLAGTATAIAETTVRERTNYQGEDYLVGEGVYSREPRCLVTRQGDPRWTDFVETLLLSLIFAEENEIAQDQARTMMPSTTLFGPRFERMFQNGVAAWGNYGEIYARHLQAVVPRRGLNLLNNGAQPRIWSFPFGNLATMGPELETISPTVAAIRERGYLNCGHGPIVGLSGFDLQTQRNVGIQADLCRAISAALFDGVDRSLFTTFSFRQRFVLLNEKRFDLAFSTSRTVQRDVNISSIGQGLQFSEVYHYAGSGYAGLPLFVDCAERLDIFSPECQGLRVCAISGSSLTRRFVNLLRDFFVVQVPSLEDMFVALRDGRCNVLLAGYSQTSESRARANGYGTEGEYVVGTRPFSIEHLAVATREDDPVWSKFVDWVTMSLVYAEEQGISQANAVEMPRTALFGSLRTNAFVHAVNAVGNFGEVYERNLGDIFPRSPIHFLNNNKEPRLFAFPGIQA